MTGMENQTNVSVSPVASNSEERLASLEKRLKWVSLSTILLLVAVVGLVSFRLSPIVTNRKPPTHSVIDDDGMPIMTVPVETTPKPEQPKPPCVGIIGFGKKFIVGGYFGFRFRSRNKGMYPFADIHAKIGDSIVFQGQTNAPTNIKDDVWQFENEKAFIACNFSLAKQLITNVDLQKVGPYEYDIPPDFDGKKLYFASGLARAKSSGSCKRGIKVRVVVHKRLVIPIKYVNDTQTKPAASSEELLRLRNAVADLSRVAVLTQLQLEQRIRSEGHSGLTDVRGYGQGNDAYNDGHFSRSGIASIHNHANNIRTVGIGEIQGVLNGVEFQTRHNDYTLRSPSSTSSKYHETEYIPFPDVPPEVLNQSTVTMQVKEMQEWFKAFKNQDWSVRDYRKYFQPILCFLEGTWISSTKDLKDPFLSDRHQLDAKTWRELHDKMRYLANSGRKNLAENIAFLPHAVRDILNDTYPLLSNWEYRIVCHKLKNDVPLQRFRVASDLSTQLYSRPATRKELERSRRARFELNTKVSYKNGDVVIDYPKNPGDKIPFERGVKAWDYWDYLMEQIPGKDNYPANLTDTLANGEYPAYHFFTKRGVLNAGYYSRYYSVPEKDAMGVARHRRGYHDAYLWVAKNTQQKVSELGYTEMKRLKNRKRVKVSVKGRYSYAIPLEIIFLTPLSKWNPYNITKQDKDSYVYANGRTGACNETKAYNGWSRRYAYYTPANFFGASSETGEGDTVPKGATCVLDANGVMRRTRASGHWIEFPSINGVGKVRQRYPIVPVHEMGSTTWKEVKALQDVILTDNYDSDDRGFFGDGRDLIYGFTLRLYGGSHEHNIRISATDLKGWIKPDGTFDESGVLVINKKTQMANQHTHKIKLTRYYNGTWSYELVSCKAGNSYVSQCPDGHDAIDRIV